MVEVRRPDIARLENSNLEPGLYLYNQASNSTNYPIETIVSNEAGEFLTLSSASSFSSPNLADIASPGDILRINNKSEVARIVLSHSNVHNTLLTTDECNNRCLFCSQPPKESGSYFNEAQVALANFSGEGVIGLTGGEPTLFWKDLLSLLENSETWQGDRNFHLLSHGRNFSNTAFVDQLARADFDFSKLLFGIPVHGYRADLHDYLTNVAGSYGETMDGLINLGYAGANLEVRIVVNSYNYEQLPKIVSRIVSSLRYSRFFIAVMQLEPAGWAKNRYADLYVPADRQSRYLELAVNEACLSGTPISLYNYPLCHLPKSLTPFAVKSISDWKNHFPKDCDRCILKTDCAGFFKSAATNEKVRPTS
jgi:His-Xaa-Ser system radical SAM maturase HxsC